MSRDPQTFFDALEGRSYLSPLTSLSITEYYGTVDRVYEMIHVFLSILFLFSTNSQIYYIFFYNCNLTRRHLLLNLEITDVPEA